MAGFGDVLTFSHGGDVVTHSTFRSPKPGWLGRRPVTQFIPPVIRLPFHPLQMDSRFEFLNRVERDDNGCARKKIRPGW